MKNLIYDELLCFGKLAAISAEIFPEVLNLGKKPGSNDSYPGEKSTNVDRRTVDVLFDKPAGGTSVPITVEGSNDSISWQGVGSSTFSLEQMKRGPCQVAISPNEYQYLRVRFPTVIGSFTGSAKAYLNTYAGK